MKLIHPPKMRLGDKVAILSPSFAAPALAPAIHEQAICRLREIVGVLPIEFPTTRKLGASPQERAEDFNAALADHSIRAILTTIGGDDQIKMTPYLDADLLYADLKPFLGYSDNTNILNWMWEHGVTGFYGGATQVHLGPGPYVDPEHLLSMKAVLFAGNNIEITDPGESEDFGKEWHDPQALTQFGEREPTGPWLWYGPHAMVSGHTWGGCLEVLDWLGVSGRLPTNKQLEDAILLLETSEELPCAQTVRRIIRALGERGILSVVAGIIVARPPASCIEKPRPSILERTRFRAEQCDVIVEEIGEYNPDAVICIGLPFGHTRPQWILPYGGTMTLDGVNHRVFASYD